MKIYKPTTPSRRGMTGIDFSKLSKKDPEKSLLKSIKRNVGRANNGRITVRHKGGGVKKFYRIIEFAQTHMELPAEVIALEYDPNRTAFIALIEYANKTKQYIISPQGLKVSDQIVFSAEGKNLDIGCRTKLKNMPVGTSIYNVELFPLRGGKVVRSAGSSAQVVAHDQHYTTLKMPSGEIRKFVGECFASVGQVSNIENRFYNLGKAGKSRHKGRRPHVRGSAMNPVDHPHGGGEGRQPIGLKYPKTPWGRHALGVKTRKRKNQSNKYIIQRRKK